MTWKDTSLMYVGTVVSITPMHAPVKNLAVNKFALE